MRLSLQDIRAPNIFNIVMLNFFLKEMTPNCIAFEQDSPSSMQRTAKMFATTQLYATFDRWRILGWPTCVQSLCFWSTLYAMVWSVRRRSSNFLMLRQPGLTGGSFSSFLAVRSFTPLKAYRDTVVVIWISQREPASLEILSRAWVWCRNSFQSLHSRHQVWSCQRHCPLDGEA